MQVGHVQSLLEFLGFFEGFVDRANLVESLLGQCIAFAVDNHVEAAQGFSQRNVFAGRTRKDFGQVERLRQEELDFTCAGNSQIGRATCREKVCQDVSNPVGTDELKTK